MEGGPREEVRAWRPAVPGITEVFHARFTEHAYPSHTHDAWTLLIILSTTPACPEAWASTRPPVCSTPTPRTSCGCSAPSSGCRPTAT